MDQQLVHTSNGIGEAEARALRPRLRGPLLLPNDAGYDEARRLWNAMIDKRPAAIVRCQTVDDIKVALDYAISHDLPLAVRGGGHNVAGTALCEGGVVIDLSPLKRIDLNLDAGRVRVEPGLTWGEVDAVTQPHGLAVPSGIVSTTGISGLTLGGGFGWLSRKYGYTCDNLLAAELVTADGRTLTASETEHPELFWGLRGGGGNFGVVTAFHYRLRPVGPTTLGGLLLYPMVQAADVIAFFREFTAAAPDELASLLVLRVAPPAPFLPSEVHGQPVAGIAVCYAGPLEEGAKVVATLKAWGKPLVDLVEPKPFRAIQTMFDTAQPPGRYYYWKSHYHRELSDGMAGALVAHTTEFPTPQSSLLMMHLGGAIRRIPHEATAAGHRDAAYISNIGASWTASGEADRCIAWARDSWTGLAPYGTGGVYVNFMAADEGPERIGAAYDAPRYARLAALKRQYDPDNVFRMNQNIRPAL